MKYKADVDGLRALAVLAVLLFHIDIYMFRGGFVGVDIFFVISGYLMTSKISSEIEYNEFKYFTYLAKRIRRLLPALAVVSTATCAAAVFILHPMQIIPTVRSGLLALFGLSNFYFYSEAGYFDEGAVTKPLLHTWSLGVEFQFYLLLPLAITLFLQSTTTRPRVILGYILLLCSFIVSWIWLYADAAGAYFLMPARAFEFGIGAIVAHTARNKPNLRLPPDVLLSAGLALIFLSAIFYRENIGYPGIASLAPTCGAALVLLASESSISIKILGNQFLATIGRLSYSIYLTHWPLIVFATQLGGHMSTTTKVFVFILTIVLSAVLYFIVERPFQDFYRLRYVRNIQRVVLLGALAIISSLALAGDALWAWRFPSDVAAYTNPETVTAGRRDTWHLLRQSNLPFTDNDSKAKILIIGDSQAGDFANVIQAAYGSSVQLRSSPSQADCQVLSSSTYYDSLPEVQEKCTSRNDAILSDKRIPQADTIIIAFNWRISALSYIESDVAELKRLGAKRIIIVGPKRLDSSPLILAANARSLADLGQRIGNEISAETIQINRELLAMTTDFEFVDILSGLCDPRRYCITATPAGTPTFYDKLHITYDAAKMIGQMEMFRNLEIDMPTSR